MSTNGQGPQTSAFATGNLPGQGQTTQYAMPQVGDSVMAQPGQYNQFQTPDWLNRSLWATAQPMQNANVLDYGRWGAQNGATNTYGMSASPWPQPQSLFGNVPGTNTSFWGGQGRPQQPTGAPSGAGKGGQMPGMNQSPPPSPQGAGKGGQMQPMSGQPGTVMPTQIGQAGGATNINPAQGSNMSQLPAWWAQATPGQRSAFVTGGYGGSNAAGMLGLSNQDINAYQQQAGMANQAAPSQADYNTVGSLFGGAAQPIDHTAQDLAFKQRMRGG